MYFPDESYLSNENREQKKLRAYYKASRQAELKRYLRQRISLSSSMISSK